jgi:hypothetical protein
MPNLDEKILLAAEQLLKRPLNDEERFEIYRCADILGMKDIQSYLHLLLVFKLHENTMSEKFSEMAALEKRILDTLETSVERILGEGAARIGVGMGETIADGASKTLTSLGEYHSLRGQTILVCFISLISTLAYWLGANNFLSGVPSGGAFEAFLFLPAGWSVFFCGATYTFLWAGDHWGRIKKTKLYRTFLGLQVFFLLILALNLL